MQGSLHPEQHLDTPFHSILTDLQESWLNVSNKEH